MANIYGNSYNNFLIGTSYGDYIYGYGGNDQLYGGDGYDYLDGGLGADFMVGGNGNDIFVVDNTGDRVVEYANEGVDEVRTTLGYVNLSDPWSHQYDYIENLTFTGNGELNGTFTFDPRNFSGTGNALDNVLKAGYGDDVLYGLGGNDTLYGLSGDDVLDGGEGADQLYGGKGNDRLYGGSGDTGDKLYGDEGFDKLFGYGGNDYLDGGKGTDLLVGGSGNDTYVVDDGDQVVEMVGSGIDTVRATGSHYIMAANVENLEIWIYNSGQDASYTGNELNNSMKGGDGAERIDGGAGNDIIDGHAGSDELRGGEGNDVLFGGKGDDWLSGGNGSDTLVGGMGRDTYVLHTSDLEEDVIVEYGSGNDKWDNFDTVELVGDVAEYILPSNVEQLRADVNSSMNLIAQGNEMDNILWSSQGNDILFGYDGDDYLIGGIGRDDMVGGRGADKFVFQSVEESMAGVQRDVIEDFESGVDKIVLGFDADTVTEGAQTFQWRGFDDFSGQAGELHQVESGLGAILEGDVNGDGVADFQILVLGQPATEADIAAHW